MKLTWRQKSVNQFRLLFSLLCCKCENPFVWPGKKHLCNCATLRKKTAENFHIKTFQNLGFLLNRFAPVVLSSNHSRCYNDATFSHNALSVSISLKPQLRFQSRYQRSEHLLSTMVFGVWLLTPGTSSSSSLSDISLVASHSYSEDILRDTHPSFRRMGCLTARNTTVVMTCV